MKNTSTIFKKILLFFIVLIVGFIGGSLGNYATSLINSKLLRTNTHSNSNSNTSIKTAYKNSTDTTEAVKKVQNAVVSVITYADSSRGFINDETNTDESQISSEGSGVIYKKDGKSAYLVTSSRIRCVL